MSNILSLKAVTKQYGTKNNTSTVLGPVDVEVKKGSFTVILGRSGSGKSTMLNLMAGLDKATSGQVISLGNDLSKSSSGSLSKYRGKIGIIFQFYNLLPNLNVIDNILMGQWSSGKKANKEYALELLKKFGIDHRTYANVKTLSGGEKQRVAICRALISKPEILFCDEPTGALDSQNELQVMNILKNLHNEGQTIILVTHNKDLASLGDSIITMEDGRIIEEENQKKKPLKEVSKQQVKA